MGAICSGAGKCRPKKVVPNWSIGPPVAATVAAGQCALKDWTECPLLDRKWISEDTMVITFGLSDTSPDNKDGSLGLATCACVLVKVNDVVRPYTPVSTNSQIGSFTLLVKVYAEGTVSKQLSELAIGGKASFFHGEKNVKTQYPFFPAAAEKKPSIGMLVGGAGVTPMIQALHSILGTKGDDTKVSLLYASRTADNILAKKMLDDWASAHPDQLTVTHVLSKEPENSGWEGERGYINNEKIEKYLPKPDPENPPLIFVCGTPQFYKTFCGDRDDTVLSGALSTLGYTAEKVIKF